MQLIPLITLAFSLCQSVLAIPTSTDDPRDPRLRVPAKDTSTADPRDPRIRPRVVAPHAAQDEAPVDRYILDYRVFGATGCFEKNWGVGTITSSQLDECFVWSDTDVKAVNLTNIIWGCSFHVYTDPSCDGQAMDLAMGSPCGGNVFDEVLSWASYKATCP